MTKTMINIADIIKSSPRSLTLWCDVIGYASVSFDYNVQNYPIEVVSPTGNKVFLTDCGNFYEKRDIKDSNEIIPCILWPQENVRTWDNWQSLLFVTGDIITGNIKDNNTALIYITPTYGIDVNGRQIAITSTELSEMRWCTEEEIVNFNKRLLFNNFTWNASNNILVNVESESKDINKNIFDLLPVCSDELTILVKQCLKIDNIKNFYKIPIAVIIEYFRIIENIIISLNVHDSIEPGEENIQNTVIKYSTTIFHEATCIRESGCNPVDSWKEAMELTIKFLINKYFLKCQN